MTRVFIIRHQKSGEIYGTKIYRQLGHAKNAIQCHRLYEYEIVEFETLPSAINVYQPTVKGTDNRYTKYGWLNIFEYNEELE